MTLPFLKTLIFFILHGYVCIPFDFLEYCTKIFFIMMTGFPGAPLNFVLKESISLAFPHPSPGCQEVTCMFSFFLGGDLVSLYENSYFYTCNTCAAHTVLLLHWGWSCEWGRASHRSCCQLLDSPVITITTTCWDYMRGLHATHGANDSTSQEGISMFILQMKKLDSEQLNLSKLTRG